jgi:hypothetical protein
VKAALRFNRARFVEWPTSTQSSSPFVIGILGEDPFGALLDEIVADESVAGRRIEIARSGEVADLVDTEILFVASSEVHRLEAILAALTGRPVLTVGEVPHFCELGGMVELGLERGRVGVELNLATAERSGLSVDSRLVRLARQVETAGSQPGGGGGSP